MRPSCELTSAESPQFATTESEPPHVRLVAVYDFFEGLFRSKLDTGLTFFLGEGYKAHYQDGPDALGLVNVLRLTLFFYILQNQEEKYMAYLQVDSPAHQ